MPKVYNPTGAAFGAAAAQGSLLSPLTKKGSISLYSRIFTVASLGALPCAIARNACSDRATIERPRSFLWIEWYWFLGFRFLRHSHDSSSKWFGSPLHLFAETNLAPNR